MEKNKSKLKSLVKNAAKAIFIANRLNKHTHLDWPAIGSSFPYTYCTQQKLSF
jgi:hypothetical protein